MIILNPKIKKLRRFNCLIPTLTRKRVSNKKKKRPGEHPFFRSKKTATQLNYSKKLWEKQKLKIIYGLTERHLQKYIRLAYHFPTTNIIVNLYNLLELRLDCVVVRLGFSKTLSEARQFITHGFVYVNNEKIRRPSFQCKCNDTIKLTALNSINNQKNLTLFNIPIPKYLKILNSNTGLVLYNPSEFFKSRQIENMLTKTLESY